MKGSHNAINLWQDKVTILKARGQHHGIATLQGEGQLAEQLADSLAFLGALWIGLDLLSGTGVATALRIVQWPTLSLGDKRIVPPLKSLNNKTSHFPPLFYRVIQRDCHK